MCFMVASFDNFPGVRAMGRIYKARIYAMNDNQREDYHDWPEDDSEKAMGVYRWLALVVVLVLILVKCS